VLVVDDTPANLTLVGACATIIRSSWLRAATRPCSCAPAVRPICAAGSDDVPDGWLQVAPPGDRLPRIFVIFLTAVSDASRRWKGWRWAPSMRQQAYRTDDPARATARARRATARICVPSLTAGECAPCEEVERITRHDLHNRYGDDRHEQRHAAGRSAERNQNRQLVAIERTANDMLDMSNCRRCCCVWRRAITAPNRIRSIWPRCCSVADESRGICAGGISTSRWNWAPRSVAGNQLLLYSMLHNLVRNATEASTAGDTVRITLARWRPHP
jgi:hypothetical protein